MQAASPLEDPAEMGSSRIGVVRAVASKYRKELEATFGPLPSLDGLPESGGPGDPAWEALPSQTRTDLTRVIVWVGKALEAYERTLQRRPNDLDRFALGEDALDAPARRGLLAFFSQGCAQCHWGPRLTDDAFHVKGFGEVEPGAYEGLTKLRESELSLAGDYSDAPKIPPYGVPPKSAYGAFKTPSLRSVGKTAPYGHDGSLRDLDAVLDALAKDEVGRAREVVPLDRSLRGDLRAFLLSL